MAETELRVIRDSIEMVRPVVENVRVPWIVRIEDHPSWPVLAKLSVAVSAEIPLKQFRVRDLLGLQKGHLFETASPETEDVPLMAGKLQLAWSEFEIVDRQLVVRLTRLT